MTDLGLSPDNYNPRVLYILKRRFNSDSKVSYHCHDYISVICILEGSCSYLIEGESYHVKKGDILICNPGVYHGKVMAQGDEVQEFHLGISNICIKNLPKDCLIPRESCPIVNIKEPEQEQEFAECCSEIMREQERNEPGAELILKSLVMKLIVILIKAMYLNEASRENSQFNFETYDKTYIVNTIVSFINDNYMRNISLDKISRNMYLSPVYISKIFKEETGDSPINYLIKVRLSKAKELLENGTMSIKAAAENVGYHDAYHFSKLFKKYYGMPPSRIKQQK